MTRCPLCRVIHPPTTPHVVGEGRQFLAREGVLSVRSCVRCRRRVWGLAFISAPCRMCCEEVRDEVCRVGAGVPRA